ncbi:actin binding protein [Cavenderia fasciculata]|uniref:Coactosin n=1 Tax=Cavenderia fasciculata TaxID=261658 RepID=F4Q789_CACFS|nr:actin binding protein [Cavenderia fasciculata]EGG16271.1 actin binding protein [Cavenderia fasciculata]|eukprot:XP_004354655.1 actin binding protein [Cavenderia fasciculata]
MADVSNPELGEAYREVLADGNDTNWTLFGYEGNSTIVLQGKGSGGLEELKSNLHDDQVQFGYLRVTSGDSESKRAKFVLISWCGEKVGPLKRAKLSVHKASVKKVILNFAVEVHAEKQEELDEDEINTKVRKASGADYSGSLAN